MKICWFNENHLGVMIEGQLRDVSAALCVLPTRSYPAWQGDLLIAHLDAVRTEIDKVLPLAPRVDLKSVRLGSPVAQPGKIIGVPVNYQAHVNEAAADMATFTGRYTGDILEQGLFLKAGSSLIGCCDAVRLSMPDRLTHHEIELAVVIGKNARNVLAQDALSYVAGYAIGLDMTIRGGEDRSLRKSLDTYSVLGPWLVTADEIAAPQSLHLKLTVNGDARQQTNTSRMILSIAQQIEWASRFYTLEPGDILMTGTCEGVGPVVAGDLMHAWIEGIGAMEVRVLAPQA